MLFKIKFVLFLEALACFYAFPSPAIAHPLSCEGALVIANSRFPHTLIAFKPLIGSSQTVIDSEVFEFHYKNGSIETVQIDRMFIPITIEGTEHKLLLDDAVIDRLSHVVYWGQLHPTEAAIDNRERSMRRGFDIFVKDLRLSGGTLSIEQVRAKIGAPSLADVESQVNDGSLFAIRAYDGSLRFPIIQFQKEGMSLRVRGLQEVLAALPTKNGAAILNFLIHPEPRLKNHRPIDLMRSSYVQPVVAAAHLYGEPGK